MKLEQSFDVSAPVEQVWKALIDIERVAPCLPGASITGRNDDGSYSGAFTIKIGPTTAAYTGKLEMQNVDESAHTATMQAQGNDRRGQGGANATINSKLTEIDGGTRVEVDTDYHITGRLARFGRGGMIEDISERLLREFAKRLQESFAGQPAGEAAPEPATAVHAAEPEAPAEHEPEAAPEPEVAAEPEAAPEPEAVPEAEPEAAAEPEAEAAPEPEAAPAPEATPEPEAAAPPPPPPPPPPPAPEPPKPPPIEPAEPLDAGSLVGAVVWERVQRNPAPFVGALAFVLTILLLRRRRRD
jgi:carbon monoxide dehydrogenase subunit G